MADELSPAVAEMVDCLRRYAAGDASAFSELFDRSAPRLLRYAQTLTRRREDAEDVVQAALVRIARHPQSIVSVQHPWGYLLKIVRNEALRLLARRRPLGGPWLNWMLGRAPALAPPDAPAMELAERDAEVQRALRKLPADQAEVIVLKIWEGMTFQEIAGVTGESANTVASRYRYALTKLETTLRRLAVDAGLVSVTDAPNETELVSHEQR